MKPRASKKCHSERSEESHPARLRTERLPGVFKEASTLRVRSFGLRPQDDIQGGPSLPHCHPALLHCHSEQSEESQPARLRTERLPGVFKEASTLRVRSFGLRPQDDIQGGPSLPHCHPALLLRHSERSEESQPARLRAERPPGVFDEDSASMREILRAPPSG